jgi:hypothetical protein
MLLLVQEAKMAGKIFLVDLRNDTDFTRFVAKNKAEMLNLLHGATFDYARVEMVEQTPSIVREAARAAG